MNDREIVDDFVAESCDHLADIESQLLAIEANGAAIDADLVNTVFRAVHSIKGTAGFLQLSNIEDLSHEMENVLNLVRNRELTPDAAITNVLLKAADTLRAMVQNVDHSGEVDVAGHLTALRAIAAGEKPTTAADAPNGQAAAGPAAQATDGEKTLDLVQTFVAEAASGPSRDAHPALADAVAADAADHAGPAVTVSGHSPTTETNIRVSVRVLDHLMNLAGELVLSRNQLLQTVGSKDRGNLDSISARLNQVTSEIQEAVMQTRLQVVETVFSKFPRVVRDLCNTLGKQCDLVVEGEDVELDKSIIEAIGDPLTHLIRNAVDHGLEMPDARVAAGKQAKGRILLKAFHQAGKVHLTVRDDGAGIDVAKVRAKAVAKGMLTPEQAHEMSDREALRLIFRPGFSTADQLTNISGRGVGMDVVRTNIERLGGTVDVESRVGQGTAVNITLPLTLAIVPSLIVRCDGRRFAIPQASISELVRVKASEREERLQRVNDAEVLRLRGSLLPLVRPTDALDLSRHTGPEAHGETSAGRNTNIIVVESGHLRYGLIVDALHDSEEIVVKPLGKNMKDCRCFAGATILGDGQVALILDVAGLASQAALTIREDKEHTDGVESIAGSSDSQSMLLFANATNEQFAVPMGLISRLERIRSDQIDTVGGQEVLQYRGMSLTLLSLERYIQAQPRQQQQRLYVIVFRVGNREIGLIAPQLTDIRAVPTEIDATTFREPGVVGSLVLEGKTIRMLDLLELCRVAHPDWFENVSAEQTPIAQAPTILLAEDSGFFRKQMVNLLQADGYNVLACEDGQVAWDTLRQPGQPYDLIVTDLEMPHMNGFDLATKVKGDPNLRRLPIIAVTSLASEDDIERGRRAGIDEYLIKLDRDQLMATIAERLRLARLAAGANVG
ncbi:MAG: chemotaxis protein CheW [Thermoguttaceae bacterium]